MSGRILQAVPTTIGCVVFGLLALTSRCTVAQPPVDDDETAVPAGWDFDFDLFQTLLEHQGLRSRHEELRQNGSAQWNQVFSTPSRSVVVLTGSLRPAANRRAFDAFLSGGGVILAASSEPVRVSGFFRIDYGPVFTRGLHGSWLGYRDCVQVTDIVSSSAVMQDVSTIVTNLSGWIGRLEHSPDYTWSAPARLPDELQPPQSARCPFIGIARCRRSDDGRLIVMADDSPLSNGMLWHGDNLTLLINLVRELTRDGRREFIFLHDGQPVESRVSRLVPAEVASRFSEQSSVPQEIPEDLPVEALANLPPEALADLPADALLEIGNRLVTRIEDSNILNEVATDRPRNLPGRFYRRSILLSACAVAVAVFVIRGILGAQTALPWLRRLRTPESRELPGTGTGMEYGQAARALARDVCRSLTGSQESTEWQTQLQPGGETRRELDARSPAPQSTADAVALVLSWSTGRKNTQLSRIDFERLGNAIHQLRQFHRPSERQSTV